MANPPPVRPWFRLTSIRPAPALAPAPTPAPAPAPAPESRLIMPLPAFRTASAPPSPHNQAQSQEKKTEQPPSSPPQRILVPNSYSSSSSLPSSPNHKPTHYSSSSSSPEKNKTNNSRAPIPTQSPKTIQQNVLTPTHSPKAKFIASPPSPLTLPASQFKTHEERSKIPMEAEPKAVLVQKTVDVPKPWHNGNKELHREAHNNHSNSSHHGTKHNGNSEFHRETQNHHNSSHHGNKHATGKERETKERKFSDSEDSGMRVITIAGENRGAYMELVQSQKKHEPNYLHKKGNLKSNNIKVDGDESESSSAEEGKITNKKDKNHKGRTKSSFPMAAYMNSNVQCVNNSLLFHASCSHHDPGVRLSLSKKPFGEGYHVKEHVNGGGYN